MSPEERRAAARKVAQSLRPMTDEQVARVVALLRAGQNPPPERSKRAQRTSTPRSAGSPSDRRPAAVGGGRT